jgi:hypothetical protein
VVIIHPWNDWYHCMCHTYGTWLPGDPKGFRTRHHREHIEGDYKNPPPPGKYEKRHRYAKSLMTRDPVYLNQRQQERALEEIVISLLRNDIPVRVVSLDRIHLHVLAQFLDHNPRKWMGIAKRESSHYLKRVNLAPVGGLWGTRCQCKPTRGAAHFDNTDGYIYDHRLQGAVVWHRSHC